MNAGRPSIGRIVLYTDMEEVAWPAIVMSVSGESNASIYVFRTAGQLVVENCAESKVPAGSPGACGKWAWPVREKT